MIMAVTNDKYELPILIADTNAELAKAIDHKRFVSIQNSITACLKGRAKTLNGMKIIKIDVKE